MSATSIVSSAVIRPEIAISAIPEDERVWVPQAKDVWFRPLLLNTVTGGWCPEVRKQEHLVSWALRTIERTRSSPNQALEPQI